ncbi:PHD finger protein MALE MEIOCYTE DEATH 1-like [Argentina anserina]|uniref:PHD finger protein MALE MEIOCYTE DEATH 1-like n=1 Tax=Argentina anserina TaxID=57926 RepID=UPI0021764073|nr:PHD finger protein MALE MEIOCYTE DEATH 1-like [Potentilla anserina]XP_050375166.1 PHD finger protein MALE MEIOCYTE DEATH 1-like [Potentilla anserina]
MRKINMMIPTLDACKKGKVKMTSNMFDFDSFGEPGNAIEPSGSFRDNVRMFLEQYAELETDSVQGMPIWCTLLVIHDHRSLVLPLYTIEEKVDSDSDTPFCDQCHSAGWSNHDVSKIKYHMIIPHDGEWNKPLDDAVFHKTTHLLHGTIHCNGFAHLLCINGLEGGSEHLCGRELMDLWDRICTNLQTRKISVEDVSKKRSMKLRLLHGVAYGNPWFGRWGYGICRGNFGGKEHICRRSLKIISSLDLGKIIQDFRDMEQYEEAEKLRQIVRDYRSSSETKLVTLQELLKFMLTAKPCFPVRRNSRLPTTKPADVENVKPVTREPLKIKRLMEAVISDLDVYADVLYLYEHVLLGYPESGLVQSDLQAVLDTKLLVKDFSFSNDEDKKLTLCGRLPSLKDKDSVFPNEWLEGSVNMVLCLPGKLVFAVDSRVTVTRTDRQGNKTIIIRDEKCSKVRIIGKVCATMTGKQYACEAIWKCMEDYMTTNPSASVHDVATAALHFIKSNVLPCCGMFIGSVEQGEAILYELDHDVKNDIRYFRERLKMVSGDVFAIGSGSEYALKVLKGWDQSREREVISYCSLAFLAAVLKDIYCGGMLLIYMWDEEQQKFKFDNEILVMDLIRIHFGSFAKDHESGLFVMYGGLTEEEHLRSIVHVTDVGHQLAISTSGFVVRLLIFENKCYRDEFLKSAHPCEKCPKMMLQDDGNFVRKFKHMKFMRYLKVGGQIILMSEPSRGFINALETDIHQVSPFFDMDNLKHWL